MPGASMRSPSRGCLASSLPAVVSICGKKLGNAGAKCWTMKTGAAKSAGNLATRRFNVSTPPADEPITTAYPWVFAIGQFCCGTAICVVRPAGKPVSEDADSIGTLKCGGFLHPKQRDADSLGALTGLA